MPPQVRPTPWILCAALSAACSPTTDLSAALERAPLLPTEGSASGIASSLLPIARPADRESLAPESPESSAMQPGLEVGVFPPQPPRYTFPALDEETRDALRQQAHGAHHWNGYLVAVPQSEVALREHYRGMPMADLYRMHQQLASVLDGKSQGSRGHTVNGMPTHADVHVLMALQFEKEWLLKQAYAQFEQEVDARLAAGTTAGWQDRFLGLDHQQIAYQLWLHQSLLNREQQRTGTVAAMT